MKHLHSSLSYPKPSITLIVFDNFVDILSTAHYPRIISSVSHCNVCLHRNHYSSCCSYDRPARLDGPQVQDARVQSRRKGGAGLRCCPGSRTGSSRGTPGSRSEGIRTRPSRGAGKFLHSSDLVHTIAISLLCVSTKLTITRSPGPRVRADTAARKGAWHRVALPSY